MTFLYALATLWPKAKRIYITLFSFDRICTPVTKGHRLVMSGRHILLTIFCFIMFSYARAQSALQRTDARAEYDLKRFPKVKYNDDDIHIQKLRVGDTIPDNFWHTPVWIVYPNEDDHTLTLNQFRNRKLIILDFWATWCVPCIRSIDKFHESGHLSNPNIAFLPVHLDYDYKVLPFIKKRGWQSPSIIGKSALVVQRYFFDQVAAGGVVWIIDGVVRSIAYETDHNNRQIPSILAGMPADMTNSNQ